MVMPLTHIDLIGSEKIIKARLQAEANSWLAYIKEQKNQLRAKNNKDWAKVPMNVKLLFAQLAGAEDFIIKFFNLNNKEE